jgi:fermentation-respiration switch protein FrsA (DUF1100 family)
MFPDTSAMLTVLALAAVAVGMLGLSAVLGISAYSASTVVRPRRNWQPAEWQPPTPTPELVTFASRGGLMLGGWYVSTPRRGAVVIVCHGFGTNRREGQDLLPWLAEAGYGVLFFDFQAHGESHGRYTAVGAREVEDALGAVDYVQSREGIEVPVLGIGFSMGASVLIAAAARTDAICGLVLDSAFATLDRAIARSFKLFFRLPPSVFTGPTIWFAERITGARVGEMQPILSIADISPRPILIVQSTDDPIVDPEDSLMLYAAAGEPKELWRVDCAGHVGARAVAPEEYRRRVLACFAAALAREPMPV